MLTCFKAHGCCVNGWEVVTFFDCDVSGEKWVSTIGLDVGSAFITSDSICEDDQCKTTSLQKINLSNYLPDTIAKWGKMAKTTNSLFISCWYSKQNVRKEKTSLQPAAFNSRQLASLKNHTCFSVMGWDLKTQLTKHEESSAFCDSFLGFS